MEEMETGTNLMNLDSANAYLEAFSQEITDSLGYPSLKWVSTLRGKFKIDGNAVDGNRLICVILAYAKVNVLYTTAHDEKKISIPACFSISTKKTGMTPHEDVLEKKCVNCDNCNYNKMGSASLMPHKQKKEGKACSNIMRLAILPIGYGKKDGDIILDGSNILTEDILFLNVPVMSVRHFTNYAQKLSTGKLKKSPLGAVTEINIIDSERTTWEMTFTEVTRAKNPEGKLCAINLSAAKDMLPCIIARHEEAKSLIMTPYPTSLPQQAGEASAQTADSQEEDTKDF